MTYDYTIDVARRLIVERWTGSVTLERLRAALATIEKDPTFDPRFDAVSDYSEARLALTMDDLRAFQADVRSRGWPGQGRRAAVAPADREFGVARQAQGLWQIDGLNVFRSAEDALDWLGAAAHGDDA
ncbi:MAG: hypothetical protein RJQ04_13700 [Longimicrobiales bacterium]